MSSVIDSRITLHVQGSRGYIWSVEDALRLRSEHRIHGSFLGGISQFKNQNQVHGLPCELSTEEVCILVGKGLAVIAPPTINLDSLAASSSQKDGAAAAPDQSMGGKERGEGISCSSSFVTRGQNRKRKHVEQVASEYESYYRIIVEKDCEKTGPDSISWRAGSYPISRISDLLSHKGNEMIVEKRVVARSDEQQMDEGGEEAMKVEEDDARPSSEVACWLTPLADGSAFAVPMTTLEARTMPGAGIPPRSTEPPLGLPHLTIWPYPDSPTSLLRLLVFSDLHSKGYYLSGGVKFGSEFLAYPGDPSEYHAQFTVRPILPDSFVVPMLLKSTSRGSHAARKHLLMATVPDLDEIFRSYSEHRDLSLLVSNPPKVSYITVAPEAGFGKD